MPHKKDAFDPFQYHVNSDRLLDGRLLLGELITPTALPQGDPMAISPEIRAYLAQFPADAAPEERWSLLVERFRRDAFEVEYDTFTTLQVAETFQRRKGNCLSVTMLLVAMARELGIDVAFNQISVPPKRTDKEGFLINFRHINLVAELPGGRQVVDFGVIDFDIAFADKKIRDREAISQYYGNVGTASLVAGDPRGAFLNLRKALELAPGNSDFWINLGVLYERSGLGELAEEAYIQALQLNPLSLVAARNLERVLRKSDRGEFAAGLVAEVAERRLHDPVYLYFEARNAYRNGSYSRARRLLERAVKREERDHRLHFLLGITSFRLQDFPSAKQHLKEAFALAADSQVKRDYERQLFELQQAAKL